MPTHLIGWVTMFPPTETVPELGRSSPVTSFIKVDFPHPEGPTTAANSPSLTSMLTRSKASNPLGPPKDRLTLFNWTNGRECATAAALALARATTGAFMPSILHSRSGALRVGSV
jgi:hypothetical protein